VSKRLGARKEVQIVASSHLQARKRGDLRKLEKRGREEDFQRGRDRVLKGGRTISGQRTGGRRCSTKDRRNDETQFRLLVGATN